MKIDTGIPQLGPLKAGEVTLSEADTKQGKSFVDAALAERLLRQGTISYYNGRKVSTMDDVRAIREGRFG